VPTHVAPSRRSQLRVLVASSLPALLGIQSGAAASTRELTLDERVAAQRAIERVYWRHRLWPAENRTPKPSFESAVREEAMHRKVEDGLRMSNAVEALWKTPIDGRQLQAELERMARGSRRPEMLRALFSALDDDPLLIAEVLVRPLLAERLLRGRFASDRRVHGALRSEVERTAGEAVDIEELRSHAAAFEVTRWRRDPGDASPSQDFRTLAPEEWLRFTRRLASSFAGANVAGTASEIPIGHLSRIEETEAGYSVFAALSTTGDEITLATAHWRKRTFDEWWKHQREAYSDALEPPSSSYRLPGIRATPCADDSWRPIPSGAPPDARQSHTAVWTGSEMIVWGGFSEALNVNTGARYDPATDSWAPTSLGPNVPAPRGGHTSVWTGSEMIVWGDAGTTGGRYDPVTDSWAPTSTGPGAPSARSSHTAVWTGSRMIVWGGFVPGGNASRRTGGIYDPTTDTWLAMRISEATPRARARHTAVWTGSRMIVWGGETDLTTSVVFRDGGSYDPVTDTWTTLSLVNAPSARTLHTAVWTGSRMIVWGGYDGLSSFQSGGRYDPATNTWQKTKLEGAPPARFDHTAVWSGTRMIVWGGWNVAGSVLATGGRYDPAANSWTPTSLGPGVPEARVDPTSVWTGDEMIIWGGSDCCSNTEVLGTGGRYDPATDTWVPTSVGPFTPTARTNQASVWTGAEMIVWGGDQDFLQEVNTGGRYDPATDTWRATTVLDAPSPRWDATAVWSGDRMIVWGGTALPPVNTGGRYDPVADTWQPTSVGANVPSPRTLHTAVWSGDEMIVWGGADRSGTNSNSGGRYDPRSDSWRPTNVAGAPSPRALAQAVWTGSQMVVWGGQVNVQFPKTGGRYQPASDSWQSMNAATAPGGRKEFSTVWTGTEMIVWGGFGGRWRDDGARYLPSADTWTPISGVAAPSARSLHVGVWTGAEMIVWGGALIGGINTGGRYHPATDTWRATSTADGTPMGRGHASAAWTGSEMVVWGGTVTQAAGGAYCAVEP
jgi:N-acetylneuraminic acid mutarotase